MASPGNKIHHRLEKNLDWADQISESLNEAQLDALKREANRLRPFILPTDREEVQKLSLLDAKIQNIQGSLNALRLSAQLSEEKGGGPISLEGRVHRAPQQSAPMQRQSTPPTTIVASINQYTGRRGSDASICTSCAAAFVRTLSSRTPLSPLLIQTIIGQGREAHEATSQAVHRGPNANLSAAEVIQHGGLRLKLISSLSDRPSTPEDQNTHYQEKLIPPLTRGDPVTAILIKAPYSYGVAYRRGQFLFFDSHGDSTTRNCAFIRTFENPADFCTYLAEKFGFDAEFPNVDFDLNSGQDNPNLYELIVVEVLRP